jgi:hypothetical protein
MSRLSRFAAFAFHPFEDQDPENHARAAPVHPIHAVNVSRGHGSSIQGVSGRGSSEAASTVGLPKVKPNTR